jgi:hypothetical protein
MNIGKAIDFILKTDTLIVKKYLAIDSYRNKSHYFTFVYFVPFLPTVALAKGGFVTFVVKNDFFKD